MTTPTSLLLPPSVRSENPPVTVTITTSGVSVTVTAAGDLDTLTARATALHREAHARCVAAPPGSAPPSTVGGYL